jgi:hypothetical protein
MDMWTTQERCPHAHSLNNKYKSQTISQGLNRPQILRRPLFSKLARSVLRHIRVASKQELKDRIMAAMDEFNRHPVVHTWSYKLDKAA